jgi:ferredoxin
LKGSCDTCAYYIYDEDFEEYLCDINMDEDDFARLMQDEHAACPYYRNGDEYAVARKQGF